MPLVQMLSERHNANAISFWLSKWLDAGAYVPSEVVLDDCAALFSWRAFNMYKDMFTFLERR